MAARLFEELPEQRAAEKPRVRGRARLRGPVRDRLELRPVTLESLIGQDHRARLSHDGVRVRAAAGAWSFRRKATLEEQLAQAEAVVKQLKTETDANSAASKAWVQAARERAARERKERLEAALRKHAQIEAAKAKGDKGETDAPSPGADARQEAGGEGAAKSEPKKTAKSGKKKVQKKAEKDEKKAEKPARVSMTDAEARVMKMAHGSFRPACNAQVTTATGTTIIVGIDVSDNGSDRGLLPDACEQARRRYGEMPGSILADGGFNSNEAV